MLCNDDEIGDEYHYLFKCSGFSVIRYQCINWRKNSLPNVLSTKSMFNSYSIVTLRKLSKFVKAINHALSSLQWLCLYCCGLYTYYIVCLCELLYVFLNTFVSLVKRIKNYCIVFSPVDCVICFIISPATKLGGGYTGISLSVCLSVCLSVDTNLYLLLLLGLCMDFDETLHTCYT
jgi:hypothetical protein